MSVVFDDVCYDYNSSDNKKDPNKAQAPQALNHISLEIQDGEFVGIIGHTGSGKSTLIQHINGLLQPTSGRVLVNGLDLANKNNRKQIRKLVGIAFQYPEYQLFASTVKEDVAFGPQNLGFDATEVDRRVRDALVRVGIDYEEIANKSPFHLSGGQQRRVALAGILAMEPQVLVLDEPMAGLDPKGREDTLSLVHGLHADGLTVIMVSHSMEDVAQNAQRVVVLNHGTIAMDGTPAQVFSREDDLRQIGLGIPQATLFQKRLAQKGFAFSSQVHTIEALADAIAAQIGPRSKEDYAALAKNRAQNSHTDTKMAGDML